MFQVTRKRCSQCLFSDAKIVSDARKREVLADCARRDSHFVCHKATLDGGRDVCCRGFFDEMEGVGQMRRIAERLGAVEFVDVPDVEMSAATVGKLLARQKAGR